MLMQIVNKLNKAINEEKVWLGHALTLGPVCGIEWWWRAGRERGVEVRAHSMAPTRVAR